MNISTKKQVVTVEKEVKVYIAEDGTEFNTKATCKTYEKELNSGVRNITQDNLIDEIVDNSEGRYDRDTVVNIIEAFNNAIIDHAVEATEGKTIRIKLSNGMRVNSKLIPSKERYIPSRKVYDTIPAHYTIQAYLSSAMKKTLKEIVPDV